MANYTRSNRQFAEQSNHFRSLCEKAGVEPNRRQAAKFRQRRGAAYRQHMGKLRDKHLQ